MKQETMTLHELVKKLIGPVHPAGESHTDKDRLENLKKLTDLTYWLMADIAEVSLHNRKRYEASMKQAGEYAHRFMVDARTIMDEELYEPPAEAT